MKIFYSWQSDCQKEYNETFIQVCLETAIRNLNETLHPKEPFALDRDTRDIPGSPDVVQTILEKIEKSVAFVGDLSFIAEATKTKKQCSNPNVMLELGYALKCLTDRCIVNVMNTAYGEPSKENMPFDLAQKRWPITYELSESNKIESHSEQEKLIQALESAIRGIHAINGGSMAAPLPLNEDSSIDNIYSHILHSNPKSDWKQNFDSYKHSAIYQKDVTLHIEINMDEAGTQCENFQAPWAAKFSKSYDTHATGYWCDIFYRQQMVERQILVSLDDHRALVPCPIMLSDDIGQKRLVKPLTYKLAEIFDSQNTLDHYFQWAGFQLLPNTNEANPD